MGAVFQKRDPAVTWHDQATINGRIFDAEITCDSHPVRTRSIQGGRITFFLLSEKDLMGDCAKSCFENGKWTIKCPEEDDEACIAQTYFISKWNSEKKQEKIK